jgi:predicted DNA-binding transcriptional regulator YafY
MHNAFTCEEMVKTPELAKRLGVSQRTIARYRKEERIPFLKISPRTIFYDMEKVESALKGGRITQGTGEFIERGRPQQ